ncbi:MAG: type II toxin-antitoxin system VapC family toxin [Deltaproteobacteria bacterium]|nr:type II toxin-antitoxin system VapC family toxin [Deltaproteobacteria bacterium]
MKNSVLDSYAVLTFLFQESGHEAVVALLEKAAAADQAVLIVAPNWAEVRYQVERKVGLSRWEEARTKLLGLPIEIVAADQDLAELAGEFKAGKRMSLADCFCAALAKQKKADLYTGDPEFKAVENNIKIIWL